MGLVLLATASLVVAEPALERSDQAWTVQNDHLVITFDPAAGGMVARVADRQGRVYLDNGGVYTDHGLFDERRYVGTEAVPAEMSSRTDADALSVVSSGTLRPRAGDTRPAEGLSYVQEVTIADEPALDLSLTLRLDRPTADVTGFLSAIFRLSDVTEWVAWTVDGRVNETFDGDGRAYQSSELPLDPGDPRLAVLYADGRRLTIERVEAVSGPLANVFLHRVGTGAGLFFAFLDGGLTTPWGDGETWQLRARLRFEPPQR